MGKIAVLHTTPATLSLLPPALKAQCADVSIDNIVDDSILPMLLDDPNSLEYAYEKLLWYTRFMARQGAQIVLCACSSVGGFAEYAKPFVDVPVVRIDEAVAKIAISKGSNIAVLATLSTTLEPSCNLLREKAGDRINIVPVLVDGAFSQLKAGNKEEHDRLIANAATLAAQSYEVVFLAQASMTDALQQIPEELRAKALSSTGPAVEMVAALYKEINA